MCIKFAQFVIGRNRLVARKSSIASGAATSCCLRSTADLSWSQSQHFWQPARDSSTDEAAEMTELVASWSASHCIPYWITTYLHHELWGSIREGEKCGEKTTERTWEISTNLHLTSSQVELISWTTELGQLAVGLQFDPLFSCIMQTANRQNECQQQNR